MKLKADISKISALIIEFTAYSFIGWLYETVLTSAVWGRFAPRGWLLHLPICPIYGFCAVILLFIFRKVKSAPLIFVLGTLLTTAAELAASYILDNFIDDPLWDYNSWAFNFEGRIALGSSLIFGVLCLLLIKVLHPFASFILGKFGGRTLNTAAAVILALILADAIFTLINN